MASTASQRPSASSGIQLIVKRELGAYFSTRAGWVLIALALMIAGIYFNTEAVGSSARYSSDVLGQFMHGMSGVVIAASILIGFRTVVEERRSGTLALLMNSSLTEGEIIFAKYAAAMVFVCVLLGLSGYMPALLFMRGKVALGHVFTGYLGCWLIGSAVVAIGIWASSIARGWLVAGAVSLATVGVMISLWRLARIVDGPLGSLVGQLTLHDRHFLPFRNGTLSLYHVGYYVAVTVVFLVLARNGLEARRWTS